MPVEATDSGRSLQAGYASLWRILPAQWRTWAGVLFTGNVLGAALEVLALWTLGALISAIAPGASAGAAAVSSPGILARWIPGGYPDALGLVVLTALVFLAKNAFLAALAWGEATFAFALHRRLADAALAGILGSRYESAARKPPAEHLNLLTSELTLIVTQLALPTLTVVSELLIMGAVVAFLFWREPLLTAAVVLTVGGAGFVMVHWGRHLTAELGRRRQVAEDERMQRLRETFLHLRDVYVYGAARHAQAQLHAGMGEVSRVLRAYQLMATSPRFILEMVLVGVLLTAILAALHRDGGHGVMVSVGVFAAAGFRLLIGANRLIMCSHGIRFARPALQRLLEAVEVAPERLPAPDAGVHHGTAPRALSARGLVYCYPAAGARVLDGADVQLCVGSMVGIRGGSGGGKTTLLEILAGLRTADAGVLLLDGEVVRDAERELFRVVGYVGQSAAVFSDTVRRNVAYGLEDEEIDDARVWLALERAHLAAYVRSLPGGLDHTFGGSAPQLSGGQSQRLGLARALYARCQFLLLDEPTSALDPATQEAVMATLRELASDCGILLVSHGEGPLACCDEVHELRAGRLVRSAASVPAG